MRPSLKRCTVGFVERNADGELIPSRRAHDASIEEFQPTCSCLCGEPRNHRIRRTPPNSLMDSPACSTLPAPNAAGTSDLASRFRIDLAPQPEAIGVFLEISCCQSRIHHTGGYPMIVAEIAIANKRYGGTKIKKSDVASEIGSRRVDVAEFIVWCRGCGVEPGETLRQIAKAQRQ